MGKLFSKRKVEMERNYVDYSYLALQLGFAVHSYCLINIIHTLAIPLFIIG